MKYDEEKLKADLQIYKQFLDETENRHYLKNHLIEREMHRQYLKKLDSEGISELSEDEMKNAFSGDKIWSSSHSSIISNIINTNGFETTRITLQRIFEYAHSKEKLNDSTWNDLFIKLIGRAWITEILSALNNDDFVLFNNSTSSALTLYGFDFKNSSTFKAYQKACDCCREICRIMDEMGFKDHTLYDADGFLNYRITGWDQDMSVNHWMYTPGKNAAFWDRMYNDGEMSVGWFEIGDLDRFVNKREMETEIRSKCPSDRSAVSPWYFVNGIKKGDTVFVRKGRNKIIGYGTVDSDYVYNPERGEYCNIRKVTWTKLDEEVTISTTGMGTLSIIYDSEKLKEYRKACGIVVETEQSNTTDEGAASFWTEVLKENDFDCRLEILRAISMNEPCTYDTLTERYGKYPEFFENTLNDLEACIEDAYPEETEKYGHILESKNPLSLNRAVRDVLESEAFSRITVKKYTEQNDLNTILYGPPGTGKTYKARQLALEILGYNVENIDLFDTYDEECGNGHISFITFHQSYSYEEFVEGIRPNLSGNGKDIGYVMKEGVFREICKKASNTPFERYVLIIDEINRGDTAQIFGELITLIEPTKRIGRREELRVRLPYSGNKFGVPDNLYIIGTMNTADRSLTSLDAAFRRRFRFRELLPDYEPLKGKTIEGIELDELLRTINDRLSDMTDRDHLIGQAYFCNVNNMEDLRRVMCCDIIPQLQEYFPDDAESLVRVLARADNDRESPFIADGDRATYVISKLDKDDDDPVTAFKSIYSKVSDDEDNDN